jgi:hypothetical protein
MRPAPFILFSGVFAVFSFLKMRFAITCALIIRQQFGTLNMGEI